MIKKIILLSLCWLSLQHLSIAQDISGEFLAFYDHDDKKENPVVIKYKMKESKEGEPELRVKFKNKTRAITNIDVTLGFYYNGILEEEALIADCLKRGFWRSWFRPIHIISGEKFEKDDLSIEANKVTLEEVDECLETDD